MSNDINNYYLLINGKEYGPLPESEIIAMKRKGLLKKACIRKEGSSFWYNVMEYFSNQKTKGHFFLQNRVNDTTKKRKHGTSVWIYQITTVFLFVIMCAFFVKSLVDQPDYEPMIKKMLAEQCQAFNNGQFEEYLSYYTPEAAKRRKAVIEPYMETYRNYDPKLRLLDVRLELKSVRPLRKGKDILIAEGIFYAMDGEYEVKYFLCKFNNRWKIFDEIGKKIIQKAE